MNAREWLDSLAERERQFVYAGAGAAALVLLLLVLVLPLHSAGKKMAARVEQKRGDLAWIRQAAPQVLAAAASAPQARRSHESLVVLVGRTAREAGLGNSLRDESPDGTQGLRLRLEAASFDAMIAWLAKLQQQYGVSIEAAAIDGGGPGLVTASLTLTRPAAR